MLCRVHEPDNDRNKHSDSIYESDIDLDDVDLSNDFQDINADHDAVHLPRVLLSRRQF